MPRLHTYMGLASPYLKSSLLLPSGGQRRILHLYVVPAVNTQYALLRIWNSQRRIAQLDGRFMAVGGGNWPDCRDFPQGVFDTCLSQETGDLDWHIILSSCVKESIYTYSHESAIFWKLQLFELPSKPFLSRFYSILPPTTLQLLVLP